MPLIRIRPLESTLSRRSTLTLLAFGLLAVAMPAAAQRGPAAVMLHVPPEVLAGKPFTMQGDIYALGVVVYQVIVGDLSRPLAEGWERDISDELLREDIAACVEGDPARPILIVTERGAGYVLKAGVETVP